MFSSRDKAEVKLYFDSNNEENQKILDQCPHLYQKYDKDVTINDRINNIEDSEPTIKNGVTFYPPYYLYNSHFMNYYGSYKIPKLNLKNRRTRSNNNFTNRVTPIFPQIKEMDHHNYILKFMCSCIMYFENCNSNDDEFYSMLLNNNRYYSYKSNEPRRNQLFKNSFKFGNFKLFKVMF
ncbi:hypothetical protein ACTFIT_009439 [Dictyostelium discoideum]